MMKKRLMMGMALVLCIGMLSACGVTSGTKTESYRIGITQIADHPSLDHCRAGFIAGLSEAGMVEGENVDLEFVSAKSDMAIAGQIAQNFAATKKDLVCGIATPSAQALYTACYERQIPVIFVAVSNPIEAKLAKSETQPMPGVSGISDALPVQKQLELIRALLPEAKKIGIVYTTSEANSVSNLKTYQKLAPEYGFTIAERGIGNQSELSQALDVLLPQVDCISNMTDNTVVAALSVVLERANAAGIPVFGSEEEQVAMGCVACAGLDYYQLGIATGKMAAKVLKGTDISTIPYETVEDSTYFYNPSVADMLGIEIPEALLESMTVKE